MTIIGVGGGKPKISASPRFAAMSISACLCLKEHVQLTVNQISVVRESSGFAAFSAMAVANVVPTASTNVVEDDVPKARPGGYEEVRETRKSNVVLPNNVAVANETWLIWHASNKWVCFFVVGKTRISTNWADVFKTSCVLILDMERNSKSIQL